MSDAEKVEETTQDAPTSDNDDVSVAPSSEGANNIVLRHVLFAAGVGLVPLPLADLAALVAANLKMLRDLAKHYGVEFREEMAKSAIASLLAAAGVPALVMPAVSLIKLIPGAGSLVGGLTVPALAGGLTYATGRVFIRHFESGGTFLDFNADRFKSMFKKEMKEGQEKAKEAAAAA
ncbi:MAG: DUF697 domain-containing protein [Alphaproteobacteria bacterium]|nr:DUF697 domain-containing protein [Alphaproteobacteria bacterium]MCB9792396.1 DUF697 domain-containing protein [Alphaproteobacteria bacterium]